MTDLASLLIKVDASEAGDAADDLNKLTAAGAKAEASTKKLGKTIGGTSNDITRYSTAMKRDFVDLGKVLSAPNSPFVAPVTQAPKVAGAMRLVSAGASVLGGIMGGLVVTGVMAATAAFVQFVLKSDDANAEIQKLVEKLKEQAERTRQAAQAQEIFDRSIEGSILKVRDLTKALNEQNQTLEHTIALNKMAAAGALTNVMTNIGAVNNDLAGAIARLESARKLLRDMQGGKFLGDNPAASMAGAEASVQKAEARVRELTGQLTALNVAAEGGARALKAVNFPLFERDAKNALDPIAAINTKFDDMAKSAKLAGTYTRELANHIETMRKAELDAARVRSSSSGLFGKQVGFDEAAAIARAAGLQVNSSQRTFEQQAALYNDPRVNRPGNPVAKPGTSAHEGVNGKWALDIQFAPGLTPQKIKKIYGDQGVNLTAVLKEKGHYHIEGRDSGAVADQRAAREAARLAEQALNRQQAFQSESERLDAEIIRARAPQAELATAMLEVERINYESALDRAVADKKIETVDAEKLKLKNAELTREKQKAINLDKQLQTMERESQNAERRLQYQIDDLRFADENALTAGEHRDIQLQILDVAYQQKEAALRDLKARLELAGKIEEAAAVQEQINRLPTEKSQDRSRTIKGTMNPLETWAASIPQTEAQITEAMQRIQVQAFDGLANSITDVIMGTKSLGQAFSEMAKQIVAEIIQMTIRMLIFKAISAAFGGGGGGGGGMLGSFGPFAKGGAFSGGNVIPFALGGVVGGPTLFPMNGGRTGMMGEAGPEAIMPLARDGHGRLGVRANDNQPIRIQLELNNEMLEGQIVQTSNAVVEIKRRSIAQDGASLAMRGASRPKLMGR